MSKNKSLLSDSGSDEELKNIKVNKNFASEYLREQKSKDLARAKELLKSETYDLDDNDESESESEDDEAEQLSTKLDIQIIKTINSLRKKDPLIYDAKKKWFGDEYLNIEQSTEENLIPNTKKKTFKDVIREQILSSTESHDLSKDETNRNINLFGYNEEQQKIRQSFIDSGNIEGDDDNGDDILQVKQKTKKELKEEELELKKALLEMKELRNQTTTTINNNSSKDSKNQVITVAKSTLIDVVNSDVFLENYLEKSLWKEKDRGILLSECEESENEEEFEEMERFESKYNFRFEELQAAAGNHSYSTSGGGDNNNNSTDDNKMLQVMGHSRDIHGSLRRVDDKRKTQRENKKEKKEREKRQQEAELKRLKNLKRSELKERLKKIAEMSGLQDTELSGLNEEFLDDDWDPEKHEALMAAQFDDDYYNQYDSTLQFQDNEDDDYRYYNNQSAVSEDFDISETIAGTAAASGDEMMDDNISYQNITKQAAAMADELYQLDYEDIIAGLPCRCVYANDFGLTTEDILLADDLELNKFVSLKKLSAYSNYNSRMRDDDRELSKKRKRLRSNLKERLAQEAQEATAIGLQLKGTKQMNILKSNYVTTTDDNNNAIHEDESKKRKRRRKKNKKMEDDPFDDNNVSTTTDFANSKNNNNNDMANISKEINHTEKKSKHKKKAKKDEKIETTLVKRLNLYH